MGIPSQTGEVGPVNRSSGPLKLLGISPAFTRSNIPSSALRSGCRSSNRPPSTDWPGTAMWFSGNALALAWPPPSLTHALQNRTQSRDLLAVLRPVALPLGGKRPVVGQSRLFR